MKPRKSSPKISLAFSSKANENATSKYGARKAMRPQLRAIKFRKYSPSEEKIFKLIPFNDESIEEDNLKTIAMNNLTHKYYRGEVPPGGQNTVSVMLRSLIRKVIYNKEPFKIERTERAGPISIKVWVQQTAAAK